MERKKYPAIVIVLLIMCASALLSQSTRRQIYDAYIYGDMEKWRIVMLDFADTGPDSTEDMLELIGYYYGYTAWLIGNEKKRQAPRYIAAAEELLEDILSDSTAGAKTLATAHAYMGAFIGYKIGLYPLKAPFLGPKSMKYTERAFDLDATNIQAHIDFGNSLFYRPGILGGNKDEAVLLFEKATALFEAQNEISEDWSYLNLLTILGQAYEELDRYDDALSVYNKILYIEPHFKWVRDELLPALKEKM